MSFQEFCAVVDLSIHHKPWLLSRAVVPKLIDTDDSIFAMPCHPNLFRRGLDGVGRCIIAIESLTPLSVGQITPGFLDSFHPPTGYEGRLSGMLESEDAVFFRDCDSEPWIVHHAQHRPIHVTRLEIERFVHGSNQNRITLLEVRDGDLQIPKTPAEGCFSPVHVDAAAKQG
jgi:hypothetical protein